MHHQFLDLLLIALRFYRFEILVELARKHVSEGHASVLLQCILRLEEVSLV